MNYKLEKFWNTHSAIRDNLISLKWTINLKSFEMFWSIEYQNYLNFMNYKLEKFWNFQSLPFNSVASLWTINLKSFEIINSIVLTAPTGTYEL